jgi:hypothetical protein
MNPDGVDLLETLMRGHICWVAGDQTGYVDQATAFLSLVAIEDPSTPTRQREQRMRFSCLRQRQRSEAELGKISPGYGSAVALRTLSEHQVACP